MANHKSKYINCHDLLKLNMHFLFFQTYAIFAAEFVL